MMERQLQEKVKQHIENNKILLLLGPKSVGKTQLIENVISNPDEILHLDANQKKTKKSLENPTEASLKSIFEN